MPTGGLSNDLGWERAKGSVSNIYMMEEKFERRLFEIEALLDGMLERSKGRIKEIRVGGCNLTFYVLFTFKLLFIISHSSRYALLEFTL